jgi:hypothetical protein
MTRHQQVWLYGKLDEASAASTLSDNLQRDEQTLLQQRVAATRFILSSLSQCVTQAS